MQNVPAPATASTTGIPFGQAPSPPVGGSAGGFVIAFVLLAVAFVVLWIVRQRGFALPSLPAAGQGSARWTVVQRLRLTPSAQAIILRDGNVQLVVVESRHGVHVMRVEPEEARS